MSFILQPLLILHIPLSLTNLAQILRHHTYNILLDFHTFFNRTFCTCNDNVIFNQKNTKNKTFSSLIFFWLSYHIHIFYTFVCMLVNPLEHISLAADELFIHKNIYRVCLFRTIFYSFSQCVIVTSSIRPYWYKRECIFLKLKYRNHHFLYFILNFLFYYFLI